MKPDYLAGYLCFMAVALRSPGSLVSSVVKSFLLRRRGGLIKRSWKLRGPLSVRIKSRRTFEMFLLVFYVTCSYVDALLVSLSLVVSTYWIIPSPLVNAIDQVSRCRRLGMID